MPKIMIVDDDIEFTEVYKVYFKMVGYETVIENQSSLAVETATANPPDLFILDLMMPEPDGFQLCRLLRANRNFVRTPVIIVTAISDEDSKLVAIGAGANDYLTKPFHIDELKASIDFLLGLGA
jgi:DNA-binding response OmpR family regulator